MVAWNSTGKIRPWKALINGDTKEITITNSPNVCETDGVLLVPLQSAPTLSSVRVLESQGYRVTIVQVAP